jgi:DNA-binding transcriptional LysR family regulator
MTIRQLQYFVTAAEERSFTAASKVLRIAQPPLSTQVRELERELGAELFRRSHRGIELTPAGRALPETRRLLQRYEDLGRLARQAQEGEVGQLTVGLIPSASNGRLPHVVRRYCDELPHVDVSLIEDRPGTCYDAWTRANLTSFSSTCRLPRDATGGGNWSMRPWWRQSPLRTRLHKGG